MQFRIWWKAWGELLLKFLALAGSIASLVGLMVPFLPSAQQLPWWAIALVVTSTFFFLVLVMLEFIAHRGRRIYAKSDTDGIKKYMHDWIEHGGRVAIWSRDLSWANNYETRGLLLDKAERGELILCLPE